MSHSTLEFLQSMLINHESKVLRIILEYIDKAVNVRLVPVELSLIQESKIFLDETMHCLQYSNNFKVPYLTAEFNLKNFFVDITKFVVDLPSVLSCLTLRDNSKRSIQS